jgi:predicted nuclease of predicted toxin-antitoxin system
MRCIIDAQLPRKLAALINELGGDAVHTLDLPRGNLTPDSEVLDCAASESRVIISKDSDFVDSLLLLNKPDRLLLLSTGNISNPELLSLFRSNWTQLTLMLSQGRFLELNTKNLILHL